MIDVNGGEYRVEGTVTPGYAGSFRVSSRRGASWFAVYSQKALANGWEPIDQPNPAAYMPVRFAQLERVPLGQAHRYTLLRPQTRKFALSSATTRTQATFVRDLLVKLDLNHDEIETCLAQL